MVKFSEWGENGTVFLELGRYIFELLSIGPTKKFSFLSDQGVSN
jgi:hypothetical protein